MVKRHEYIYILDQKEKEKLLKLKIGITSYHPDIIEIINNNGCTNKKINHLSSYIKIKAGREVLRERFITSNEETRFTIFDSLIRSDEIGIPKKIMKTAMILFLYKEYNMYFFETLSRSFMFFLN